MTRWRMLVCSLLLGAALPTLAHAQAARLTVVGFETTGSVGLTAAEYEALGRALKVVLESELGLRTGAGIQASGNPVMGRGGRIDLPAARTAATGGGATAMIVGTLLDQYGDIHIEARLVTLAGATPVTVLRSPASFARREQLAEALADLAGRIGAEPGMGGARQAAARTALPVDALLHFGRGLGLENAGDRVKAAEAYRAALKSAPGFSEATAALQRVGAP